MASGEFRLRIRFAKTGRLRWLSHLETTHAIERSVRRAGLPYAVTRGFSPRMKIAFGHALPVGTAGERECFDLWLTRYVPAAEALGALTAATPEGLLPSEAWYASDKEPSLSAGDSVAGYDAIVEGVMPDKLAEALGVVTRAGELVVEHKGKDKVFDLTRSLPKEPCVEVAEDGRSRVRITVRIGPEGSLRPETLISSALSLAGLTGAVTSVTRTEIQQVT